MENNDKFDLDFTNENSRSKNNENKKYSEADKAIKELSDDTMSTHFDNINLLVLSVILIFGFSIFIAVNGKNTVNESPAELNSKTFLSGEYENDLEEMYNSNIPFPQQIKAIEERISMLYGIGNKLSDKPEFPTESNRNMFDDNSSSESENQSEENIITQETDNSKPQKETSSTKKTPAKTTRKKSRKETTSALQRPEETYSVTTEMTTAEEQTKLPSTNNTPPVVTITTTTIHRQSVRTTRTKATTTTRRTYTTAHTTHKHTATTTTRATETTTTTEPEEGNED